MAKKLFGTDGIRGVAGKYPLDDRTIYAAGLALGKFLRDTEPQGPAQPKLLIGMDTRESSPSVARLLAGGLDHADVRVKCAGVIPTAGVAHLTRSRDFAAGVMISASHNLFEDNGIKIFSRSGRKLPDSQEHEVECCIFEQLDRPFDPGPKSFETDPLLAQEYLQHLLSVGSQMTSLDGRRIVVDCANGAASELAPLLFEGLGISAEIMAREPNGRNINLECGSLHLETLQRKVIDTGACLGVAFDGDADRALFVAGEGAIVDGDLILLMAADYLARQSRLAKNLIVTTVMANMGLEKALRQRGIRMIRTPVGDKYVLEEMLRQGAVLGGEQSGHIIFREYATTGDGLLTARMILEILAESGRTLNEWKRDLKVFPQQLKNLPVKRKVPFDELPAVTAAISQSKEELCDRGRIVVRYSGTEPLVRIMVEAESASLVEEHVGRLVQVFRQELGS